MEAQDWDTEANGPLTSENVSRYFRGQGYTVSDFEIPAGFNVPRHQHGAASLGCVLSGEYSFIFESETVIAKAGQYFNMPVDVRHSETVPGDTPCHIVFATMEIALGGIFTVVNGVRDIGSAVREGIEDIGSAVREGIEDIEEKFTHE